MMRAFCFMVAVAIASPALAVQPDEVLAHLVRHSDLMQAALLPDRDEFLASAIQAEFRNGDTVLLDRWVVALSEARIAAAWQFA